MVYAQFLLFLTLMWATALTTYIQHRAVPRGGPFYYVDTRAQGLNPIQDRFKIKLQQVPTIGRSIAVINDNRGLPYLIKDLDHGIEVSRRYYYRDGKGRLRYEGVPTPWGMKLIAKAPAED